MIILLLFVTLISALQPRQLEQCQYPINYTDFTLILINHTLVITGGNTQTLQVWTRDLYNGLDIHQNCWTIHQPTINTTTYQPYTNGIGFKSSDTSFAVQAGDSLSPIMSNLAIFDLITNAWSTPIALQGTQPSPRARMSVSLNTTTNVAWFYGGRSEKQEQTSNYFNSFYNFDITTSTWNWPTTYYSGGYRPARYGHSSNLISERLFIVGGKTAIHSDESNSWTLSPGDFQSILVYDTLHHQAISMATIGNVPPARYSFSTVNAPDGKSIVLFGGQNVSSEGTFDASNDIYILDTCTLNWSQPILQGTPPIARAGHEALVYRDRYMIVMMGIQNFDPTSGPVYIDNTAILDMKTWTWITSIPPFDTTNQQASIEPTCRFTFPVVIPDSDNGNGSGDSLDSTVVSNTSNSPTTKQLALGITFGVLGFLLLATALVIFIMRIRRDVDATQNPRWILRKKKKHDSLPSATSSASADMSP